MGSRAQGMGSTPYRPIRMHQSRIPLTTFATQQRLFRLSNMASRPRAHIIAIDDDVEHLLYVTTLLTRANYDCASFTNTRSALAHMRERHVDLVIADLFMPEMDGFETLAAIRQVFPDVAVLILSGCGRMEEDFYLECAKHLGAVAVLKKPFEPEELRAIVSRTLSTTPKAMGGGTSRQQP